MLALIFEVTEDLIVGRLVEIHMDLKEQAAHWDGFYFGDAASGGRKALEIADEIHSPRSFVL